MANSAVFYFLNQGILMRFMAARSVREGRRAVITVLVVLMPIAAIVVASGGWVGKAMEHAGILPPGMDGGEVFFIASEYLSRPGIFGLIMAALTAALMSTVDTLITAVAAIVVNDIYRPQRPDASDPELLRAARYTSVGVALVGVGLVPVFGMFKSIYAAHAAFTAAVTPPLIVALLLSIFWRRFTAPAAIATLAGGAAMIVLSILVPELVAPFAQGVPPAEVGDGLFEGAKQYKYTRALYGLFVSSVIGVTVALFTKAPSAESMKGLVWGTVADAIEYYKGRPGKEEESAFVQAAVSRGGSDDLLGAGQLPQVRLSPDLAARIEATAGDVVYVSDTRRYLGGLRSGHALVAEVSDAVAGVEMAPAFYDEVVSPKRAALPVRIQRLY
jgi:SSS family solute:Na+ symporter